MLKKVLLIFVFCLGILQVPVYADVCTDDEMETLEALADKVEISKEFSLSEVGRHGFDLNAYNLNNKLYIQMPNGLQVLTKQSQNYLGRFWQGQEFEVYIYASENSNCGDELLRTMKITLEKYNEYFSREECKTHQNLDICKQWTDTEKITEEEFLKLIKEANQKDNEDENSNAIIELIKDNAIYIFGAVTLIIGLIIIVKKQRDKNRIKIEL